MDIKSIQSFLLLFYFSSMCFGNELKFVTENEAISLSAAKKGQILIIELQPKIDSKIPLDPGIKISSKNELNEGWMPMLPTTFFKSEGYMDEPKTINLTMLRHQDSIDLTIEHAYCPSEELCQFLNLEVHIP